MSAASDLVAALNPGWPVEWAGRTWLVSAPGPLSAARLEARLQMRAAAAGRGGDPARWAEHAGRAAAGGAGVPPDELLSLTLWSLLSVNHPEVTAADVAAMRADPAAAPQLAEALALAMASVPDPGPREPWRPRVPWSEAVDALLRRLPGLTLHEAGSLSFAQLAGLRAAGRKAAGDIECGFTMADVVRMNGQDPEALGLE
jgi:hypothetical protein